MTLAAAYDLAKNPPTYDVVAFLANLELECLARGEPDVDLHVLPGPDQGFRRDSLWPKTVEERVHLRDGVVVPLCRMLPSVRSVTVQDDRKSVPAETPGVNERWISLPRMLRALREGSRPLRALGLPSRDSKLITMTLREAEHHPERNSRIDQWVRAAQELEDRGWNVVVLRDALRAFEPLSGVRTAAMPAVDLDERASYYARAALNVGISNGPMWMAVFMDAPVLMLRPTTNSARGGYDDKFYARCGLPPGSQLPTSPPHQRLVWEEDTRDNIVGAVEEMLCPAG